MLTKAAESGIIKVNSEANTKGEKQMFCGYCGSQIGDGSKYCPNCGAPVNNTGNTAQAQSSIPISPTPYAPFNGAENGKTWAEIKRVGCIYGSDGTRYGIGWMKFLLYFSFFATAFTNLISAILLFTGATYGEELAYVREFFPMLRTLDIIYGFFALALGRLAIFVRFRISGLKRDAMRWYLILFVSGLIIGYIYLIACAVIVGSSPALVIAEEIGSDITSIIVFVVNYAVYFKHRECVFIND